MAFPRILEPRYEFRDAGWVSFVHASIVAEPVPSDLPQGGAASSCTSTRPPHADRVCVSRTNGLRTALEHRYAGEDMQVPSSERFFNKTGLNDKWPLPADLHFFPCISVGTGPDRTGQDRTGPDSTGSPILAIAAQTPTPKHLHMFPGMQKGRPPVWEWRPLRRYWVTQLDPGGWN